MKKYILTICYCFLLLTFPKISNAIEFKTLPAIYPKGIVSSSMSNENTIFKDGVIAYNGIDSLQYYNGIYESKHTTCSHLENLQKSKNMTLGMEDKINQLQKIEPLPTNYDVLKYDLFMDWSDLMNPDSAKLNRRNYIGTMKMTVLITENYVDSLEFNSEVMNIFSVTVNKFPTRVLFDTTEYLNAPNYVYLDKVYGKGDTVVVEFTYEHLGTKQLGLYFYTKETTGVLETITYTMSQPENARIWMPCKDRPDDKALSKITIRVPKGYEVVSNGLLTNKIDNDNATIFIWDNDIPIPTYLMNVISSKYFKWADFYKPKNNPNDSIEVSYYAWEQDMPEFNPSSIYKPRPSMSKTVEMISFLSDIFLEYPYQKYSQAAAFPFPVGGMEHQTATTINRWWLKNTTELGVVHEVGHHWLGDMISGATWYDVWINEGGATWIEWLWILNNSGLDKYKSKVIYNTNLYLDQKPHNSYKSIYGFPASEFFNGNNYYLIYIKAGLVYNMLYKMLGDEFILGLRKTLVDYQFQSLTTEEFKVSLKKNIANSPVDIDVFFDQWLYKPAHPILQLDSYFQMVNGKYKLTVKINQTQKELLVGSEVPEVFQMPIKFLIDSDAGIIEKTVLMNDKYEQYSFDLDNEPLDVNIDLTSIIAMVNKNPMSIENQKNIESDGLSIFPNPIVAGENANLKLYNLKSEVVNNDKTFNLINSYEIFDLNGKLIETNNNVNSSETTINTQNLESGIYVIKTITTSKIITNKFTVIK